MWILWHNNARFFCSLRTAVPLSNITHTAVRTHRTYIPLIYVQHFNKHKLHFTSEHTVHSSGKSQRVHCIVASNMLLFHNNFFFLISYYDSLFAKFVKRQDSEIALVLVGRGASQIKRPRKKIQTEWRKKTGNVTRNKLSMRYNQARENE